MFIKKDIKIISIRDMVKFFLSLTDWLFKVVIADNKKINKYYWRKESKVRIGIEKRKERKKKT